MNQKRPQNLWQKRNRQRAIDAFGGKCGICGYSKCINALEFHHIDPSEKRFGFSNRLKYGWNKMVVELRKCILICANCHREIHHGITKIPVDINRFDEKFASYKYKHPRHNDYREINQSTNTTICSREECNNIVTRKGLKYCSIICSSICQRHNERPSKNELTKLLKDNSYYAVGRMFNVSHGTIKKWEKFYNDNEII